MRVAVSCRLREVVRGTGNERLNYSGKLIIGKSSFSFSLHFGGPLCWLSRREFDDIGIDRIVFGLTLKNQMGKIIELDDEEFIFFLSVVLIFVKNYEQKILDCQVIRLLKSANRNAVLPAKAKRQKPMRSITGCAMPAFDFSEVFEISRAQKEKFASVHAA